MPNGGKGTAKAHATLAILFCISLVSYLDRQLIALLAPDIQRDLRLEDWQIGFVSGTSFALLYVFMSVPLAYLADRRNRVRLLAACLTAWSVMTGLCGAAQGFGQLSLARVGVAVGEAGGYPASLSMIGDLYPAERRATVTAIYFAAVPAGTLFSLYLGGMLVEAVGWRLTFTAAAAPGLVLALVLLALVREPLRGAMEPGGAAPAPMARSAAHAFAMIGQTLRTLLRDPVYRWIAVASALGSVELFAIVVWSPSYAIRAFALDKAEVGRGLGLATAFISAAVMIAGGALADRLTARTPAAPLVLAAVAQVLCIALLIAALNATNFTQFCILSALAYGASTSVGPMTIAVTQSRITPSIRATGASALVMISTLAGYGLGPALIGAMSDLAQGDPATRLRTALTGGLAFTAVAAVVLAHAARRCARPHG
ncbi:MFS transporter [Novosphingobium sp. P6W]|uniref:spinster family MFS transporter n=1 Tax=Novosphingobium sp. P6W TaxID=1609758 RepID=UPI0005C315AC|nr:MFS transporter [Novosphingobium sp. P6W]KIS31554.1 hypothetical protein TQ38_15555 [Novosphingobium sp. P6W]